MLPAQITIIHCKAHQKDNDSVSAGNNRAKREAKPVNRLPLQATLVPSLNPFSPQYTQEETQWTFKKGFPIPQKVDCTAAIINCYFRECYNGNFFITCIRQTDTFPKPCRLSPRYVLPIVPSHWRGPISLPHFFNLSREEGLYHGRTGRQILSTHLSAKGSGIYWSL